MEREAVTQEGPASLTLRSCYGMKQRDNPQIPSFPPAFICFAFKSLTLLLPSHLFLKPFGYSRQGYCVSRAPCPASLTWLTKEKPIQSNKLVSGGHESQTQESGVQEMHLGLSLI